MIKKMNMYFFGEEQVSVHDVLWYYGSLSAALIIGCGTLLSIGF